MTIASSDEADALVEQQAVNSPSAKTAAVLTMTDFVG